MAKARTLTPARDRALAAFRRALPSCDRNITVRKARAADVIVVRGYDCAGNGFSLMWSYKGGSLRRVL